MQHEMWTEYAFSQSFFDEFDMGIFADSAAMNRFLNSGQYPVELVTDIDETYRVWDVTLPQSERHHVEMMVIDTSTIAASTSQTASETEYKILVTKNTGQINDPQWDSAFSDQVKQAEVCCIVSIGAAHGIITITTYGDTAEECIAFVERFMLEIFQDAAY